MTALLSTSLSPLATLLNTPDCSADGSSLECRLLNLLHLLHVLGAVLGIGLLVALIIAIRAWRAGRNSNEIPSAPHRKRKSPHA